MIMISDMIRGTVATMVGNGATCDEMRKELKGLTKSQANNVIKNQRKKAGKYNYTNMEARKVAGKTGNW